MSASRPQMRVVPRMDDILEVICAHYQGVTPRDLRSVSRAMPLPQLRGVAAYIASTCADMSAARIGAALGGRDASTIICAIRKTRARIAEDREAAEIVEGLEIAATSLATLRARGVIRSAVVFDPAEVARRVVANDDRAASTVSLQEIRSVCEELVAARAAPEPAASPLRAAIEHFIVAENRHAASARLNTPGARAPLVALLAPHDDDPAVARALAALRGWKNTEHTIGEKHAREVYGRAVLALSKRLSDLVSKEQTAHG